MALNRYEQGTESDPIYQFACKRQNRKLDYFDFNRNHKEYETQLYKGKIIDNFATYNGPFPLPKTRLIEGQEHDVEIHKKRFYEVKEGIEKIPQSTLDALSEEEQSRLVIIRCYINSCIETGKFEEINGVLFRDVKDYFPEALARKAIIKKLLEYKQQGIAFDDSDYDDDFLWELQKLCSSIQSKKIEECREKFFKKIWDSVALGEEESIRLGKLIDNSTYVETSLKISGNMPALPLPDTPLEGNEDTPNIHAIRATEIVYKLRNKGYPEGFFNHWGPERVADLDRRIEEMEDRLHGLINLYLDRLEWQERAFVEAILAPREEQRPLPRAVSNFLYFCIKKKFPESLPAYQQKTYSEPIST